MLINSTNLQTLYVSFNAAYQRGLGMAERLAERISTTVPSSTRRNEYGWLGQIPNVREWLGDRVVHQLESHDYSIVNKAWENTIGVKRDDIEDDNIGIYGPLFEQFGRANMAHRETLIWNLLKKGFSELAYDGQFFFDTDHPVLDEDGNEISVANTDGGAGTPWFLIDDTQSLRPIILQMRRDWQLVRKDRPEDDNVFDKGEFVYGSDARYNVGFGFWQFAWGSKQPLDKTNYAAGRQALMGMKGDYDRALGVRPRLLLVPPALEGEGLEIVNAERDSAGATNVYKGTAELLVVPWLA